MGNIDSSNKSEKNLRKSSTSKESKISEIKKAASEKILRSGNNQNQNQNQNHKNYDYEDLKKNKNKSIIDIVRTKIDRSKVLDEIDSLKILQISSKINSRILNKNLDYFPINFTSANLIPFSKKENLKNFEIEIDKEIFLNLNSTLANLNLEENFSEQKKENEKCLNLNTINNNKNNNCNDKIYFNNLIKNNSKIGKSFQKNLQNNEKKKEINSLLKKKLRKLKYLSKKK